MTSIGVFQTVGDGFNAFSRQFGFESTNNHSRDLFEHAPFASLRLNNSGKTLPQDVSNLVNTSLYRPSTQQQFEDLATQLSQQVQFIQRDLRFTVDEHSGKTVIVVMDSQADEVIREIPSEKLRQLAHNLRTLQERQEQLDGSSGHLSALKGHLLDVRV
ncbi:flagellar protein FlaG [Pseudomonadales bacterium]|nr:flagellar protein FlaG [Pseudomonadales bacterium]